MSTRVRLVLLSLVITLLVMWLPAISYAEPIEVRGKLVSRDDQTKRVEIQGGRQTALPGRFVPQDASDKGHSATGS